MVTMICIALLSACGGGANKSGRGIGDDINEGVEDASTAGYSETVISGLESDPNLGPGFSDPQNPLSQRTIYFEYDSSQVKEEFLQVIYAHAEYLTANPGQRIILEGHADERGSREYNIALGEQRAHAVARMMTAQGVSRSQLKSISYGEEKPAVEGHDDAAWQQNRRVELVYQGQ